MPTERTAPVPREVIRRAASVEVADEDRSVTFVASDETVDRYGDIVSADGWQLEPFRRNPIFLWMHGYRDPIGTVTRIAVEGRRLLATATFAAAGISEEIDRLWKLTKAGVLRAVSVGFTINDDTDWEFIRDDNNDRVTGIRYLKPELLELSLVTVPANPNALALARSVCADPSRFFDAAPPSPFGATSAPAAGHVRQTPPAAGASSSSAASGLSQLSEARHMDTEDAPVGALRTIAGPARLSDGLPVDVATQVERTGRVSYSIPRSVRDLAIVRAPLLESGVGGLVPPTQGLPVASGYLPFTPMLIDLVPSQPVSAQSVVQNRITYADPNGNAAAVVPEGATKPESTLVATATTLEMATWAHWVQTSTQALADIAGLRALIDQILTLGLREKISAGIFTTMTTAGNFTPFAGSVAGESVGDGIARAVAQLAAVGGQSIVAAINPADALTQQLAKATGSGIYLGLPPGLNAQIVASASVPAGNVLSWASGFGFWATREEITVLLGMIDQQFIKNLRTILAETRGALVINVPRLIVYGPVTTVAAAAAARTAKA